MNTDLCVFHIIDSAGIYGAEKVLLHLMEEQARLGFRPILGSIADQGVTENALEREAGRRQLQVVKLRMRRGFDPAGVKLLLEEADRSAIDLFHVHGYKGTILLGCLTKKLRKRPTVRTIHGRTSTTRFSKLWLYEMLDLWNLRRMDAVISVIPGQTEIDRSKPPPRYAIANGIPPAAIPMRVVEATKLENFCRGAFVIGAIGRLSAEKNFACLLHALAKLSAQRADYQAIILGEGPLRPELEEIIKKEGLREKVLLLGYKEQATAYFPYFNLLAIPSSSEGLPLVLLEAMQAGIPVVATRVGGIPWVLEEGRCGNLVPPNDPDALAAAIALLRENKEATAEMASRARQIALNRYSSSRMAAEYALVYEQVLGSRLTK
jgi:glycosyltransferase involved in cell wall biosynthesis